MIDTTKELMLDDLKKLSTSKKERILRYFFAFSNIICWEDYSTDFSPLNDLYYDKETFFEYYKNRAGNLFSLKSGFDDFDEPYFYISSKCHYLDILPRSEHEHFLDPLSKVFSEDKFNEIKEYYEQGLSEAEAYIEDELCMTKNEAHSFINLLFDCLCQKLDKYGNTFIDAVNIVVNDNYNQSALFNQIHFLSKVNKELPVSHINDVLSTLELVEPNHHLFHEGIITPNLSINQASQIINLMDMDNKNISITKEAKNGVVNLQKGCTVQPQTKEELAAIIKQTCEEQGWDCDLNFIDTSKITDMSFLFSNDKIFGYGLCEFNGDISKWNTSNVEDMSCMFQGAESFNHPLDNWDTSNVENMSYMFNGACAFNQPINNWNISKVTDMESMFNFAESFNQPLDNWNISNVTNMEAFLFFAKSFNQDLRNWKINDDCFIDFMFDGTSSLSDTLIPLDLQNDLNINTPNANFNSESNIFIDASKNDPLLNKTNAVYLQADRIWIFPKNELNFENSFVLDKTCYKTFDDVLSCIPMSKSDLGKLFLKNQKTNNCLNKSANYSR